MTARPYIIGTGSFVPETRVTNKEMMELKRPLKPNGKPMEDDWLERHFGIVTRAFDFDARTAEKKPRELGGIYDGDCAVQSAQRALEDAKVKAGEVDVLVHVSCTPDTLHCGDHLRYIVGSLGLRKDVKLTHHDLGCAGLASGLDSVMMNLLVQNGRHKALLIASNCPSAQTASQEAQDYYTHHPHSWTWASRCVFGDGGGAIVLGMDGTNNRGLLCTGYETDPNVTLVTYPAGGGLHHTRQNNVGEHVYVMDADRVSQVFVPLMQRNLEMLEAAWLKHIEPVIGRAFSLDQVKRWFFHQANGPAVKRAAEVLGISPNQYSMHIQHYGNLSAASTLVLLDEDRRAGVVQAGDLIVFMWIGAGNGAQNGYAAFVL